MFQIYIERLSRIRELFFKDPAAMAVAIDNLRADIAEEPSLNEQEELCSMLDELDEIERVSQSLRSLKELK